MDAWALLQSPVADAAINMATDEVLLRTAARRGCPILRLYAWQAPSLSIGYFQKFPVELANRYDIVRRPTGGGWVYHVDDTTFSVVVPPGHRLHRLKTSDAYCAIHAAVAAALPQPARLAGEQATPRGTYECFRKPVAGDVVAGDQKLAGGAQRRNRDGMLHQGSIAARVADRLPDAFRKQFDCEWKPYRLTDEERAMITWLADGKYRNDAWNRRVS